MARLCRQVRRAAVRLATGGLAALVALPPVLAQPAPDGLDVTVESGRMSASLGAVPVVDVLGSVAHQTGASLSVRGELGNVRPQAFTGEPLAAALPRLVQPNGLILQFDRTGGRLLAIHAVAPGAGGGAPTTVARGNLAKMWNYEDGQDLPDAEKRIQHINRMAKQRSAGQAAVQSLTYVMSGDPDPAVRRAALGLLAGLPGDDARRTVMQTVADTDPEMRIEALRVLATTGEKPVSLLAQAVKGDVDASVRLAAIGMLDRSDGDLARAVLEGARSDSDPQVREAAQQSLHR